MQRSMRGVAQELTATATPVTESGRTSKLHSGEYITDARAPVRWRRLARRSRNGWGSGSAYKTSRGFHSTQAIYHHFTSPRACWRI